ncbi:hypothetical protein [Photobacterium leiognathi]|uniref:Uncharacterized protein n=1 Tax=Photobacterium leiognathi subsp. mandapamensis TaxID=48408 RepID=A0A2T3KPY9_PHOLD|nr:hypothetical protein [Photobacterium leiognathi]PSV07095.1 hypothetical protein C0W93_19805 [Photobacterium leiognathi subsp. mandapamensis]PSW44695.1 hypothetical protein C0W40_07795 [Photobacterium leiognathi subsp. mandapamensis]PSW56011.1 hypothetical protein C0W50_15915 [Photobacterium leiognathi subsp. mandapamensis]
MSMTSVTITVPSHFVPGGLPTPDCKQFGFNGFERSFIRSAKDNTVTFAFFAPTTNCNEEHFDEELEKYFWYFSKGTPFTMKKEFDDQPPEHHQCKYLNNKLIQESLF